MNKQNLVSSHARILCATALFLAALVCVVWAEGRSPQQQYIDLCTANYNQCTSTLCANKPTESERQICEANCRADELTCFNNSINATVPGTTPVPNKAGPNPTPTPSPTPRNNPIDGAPGKLGPNPTPTPSATPRRHPVKGLPHKLGPSPSATAKPILLAKPKPTASPKPTPKKSNPDQGHGHH
jgi:hypothetical protein